MSKADDEITRTNDSSTMDMSKTVNHSASTDTFYTSDTKHAHILLKTLIYFGNF